MLIKNHRLELTAFITTMSIKKRYLSSIFANTTRSGLSFLTGLLLARFLGPVDYGRLSFLLASFLAIKQILDAASSSAFFTFISQRQRSKTFIEYYWIWVGFQFLVPAIIISFLLPDSWMESIWKGEERGLIVIAFIASFVQTTVWTNASQMAEAQRETIKVQSINTLVVGVHLLIVLLLWYLGQLAIVYILIALILEFGIASLIAFRLYKIHIETDDTLTIDTPKTVFKEFWNYCLPFIPYSFLGFLHDFLDRWMLQNWGGASEQAYYSISYQFAGVALLATSSILRIFWKEIAEAYYQKDFDTVHQLYTKSLKGLYFIGAVLAGGLIPWTEEIVKITLGEKYITGAPTMMLMFLYPIHQSMGQITGTVLYATGHTRLQVIYGMFFMALSLVVAYFFMAPNNAIVPGLNLSSKGLAYKMVLVQFLGVNVLAFFIARLFHWKYDWFFQVTSLALTLSIGWSVSYLVNKLIGNDFSIYILSNQFVKMIVAAPIYLICILGLLYVRPSIAGITREEIIKAVKG
jgi:O-antigen/teichoic acid export membrane protein